MRSQLPVALMSALSLSSVALPAAALTVSLTPAGDTHIDAGDSSANHAGSDTIFVRHDLSETHGLLRFDLSALAGWSAAGDGVLSLFLESGLATVPGVRSLALYAVAIDWDPNTVTYDSFGTAPGLDIGTDVAATPLAVVDVDYPGGNDIGWFDWTLPASLLNAWITDPASNQGLLLRNDGTANTRSVRFTSSEGPSQPTLTFAAVPAPATALLLGAGVLGLSLRRIARGR